MYKRTYGWVQNPSNFDNLKLVVQVFDPASAHYAELKNVLVPQLIPFVELKAALLKKLDNVENTFLYQELVGTSKDATGKSASERSKAVADGLIQVSILPQSYKTTGKRWTDNWTADGYLRWALSLNLVSHDRATDACSITDLGLQFSQSTAKTNSDPILINAILAYPPASRVLEILAEKKVPLNKFEIGALLGFKGEKGFTSYPADMMQKWLLRASSEELKKIKSDVEGTADKYARMISTWLEKLGFVKKNQVIVNTVVGQRSGFQTYELTGEGLSEYNRSKGSSKNKRLPKYINWEFLAIDGKSKEENDSRDYVRTRRAYILKKLESTQSFNTLKSYLQSLGFMDKDKIIRSDIEGLQSIGIRIRTSGNTVKLLDEITGLDIPKLNVTTTLKTSLFDSRKNAIIEATDLPPKYYELIDIAFDNKRNRDFEMLTVDFFKEVYGFDGSWLGGGRRPDGIVYSEDPSCPFGVIIDTKAYSNGYSKSIQQEDEMVRYIEDNIYRDELRNNTKWWESFGSLIQSKQTTFLWVSSVFNGRFGEQLTATHKRTNVHGAALSVEQLLIGGDLVNKKLITLKDFAEKLKSDAVIDFSTGA